MAALASGTFSARLAAATGAAPARAGQRIPYGACVNLTPFLKESDYRIALETYCQQLTPEFGLFWDYLRPARGQFNFDFADKVLAFAEINEMTMRGHTLVWYGAMPNWTKEISSTAEAERELTGHIEKVVARYRGKIKTWHVVNEPIDDARGTVGALRPSVWLQHLGPKYIDMAFRLAHRVDPAAELVLNEYDIECVGATFSTRRRALLTLVRDLLARGVPLHGIGLQGHIQGKYQIDEDGLSSFVSEVKSLGLSVHVTELDVIDKELPGPIPVRDAIVAARAHDFLRAVFAAARPSVIATWGITDRYTWVPTWNKREDGLANRPLPLDEHYQPKPLWSVIDYFCRKTA
ncbi:MAG: endo-1,4-beta-xylanase [Xanthobacteraceae bacterium]